MRVYCCQLDIAWENKALNFERARALLERQRIAPNSLIVLPEMFATGFSMNADAITEPVNGETSRFLRDLAKNRRAYVVGGFVRRRADGNPFNEALCLAPSGRCLARYAKLHPFSPGGEPDHYRAGNKVTLFRWGRFKVAVYICYDLRFPEVFRMGVEGGADVLLVIANWPARRHAHWLALLRARAIENQAYAIGVNRCGRDPHLAYAGGSVIVDPQGSVLSEETDAPAVVSADLDPEAPARWRREFPALRDIRTRFALGGKGSNEVH